MGEVISKIPFYYTKKFLGQTNNGFIHTIFFLCVDFFYKSALTIWSHEYLDISLNVFYRKGDAWSMYFKCIHKHIHTNTESYFLDLNCLL